MLSWQIQAMNFIDIKMAETCFYWLSIMTTMMKADEKWIEQNEMGLTKREKNWFRFSVLGDCFARNLIFTVKIALEKARVIDKKNWFKSTISKGKMIFTQQFFCHSTFSMRFILSSAISLDKMVSTPVSSFPSTLSRAYYKLLWLLISNGIHFIHQFFAFKVSCFPFFFCCSIFLCLTLFSLSSFIALMFIWWKASFIIMKCVIQIHKLQALLLIPSMWQYLLSWVWMWASYHYTQFSGTTRITKIHHTHTHT